MKVNIHAGHAPFGIGGANGAVNILNESVENRKVKNEVIRLLNFYGIETYDNTCDKAYTQNEVLKYIVRESNSHLCDIDISIHLNSGRGDSNGDGSTGGVEVLVYDNSINDVASRISQNIATALGINNRGVKINKDLYFLNSTKDPAILIECCFVDDKDDADKWNVEKCASAIVQGILGQDYSESSSTEKLQSKDNFAETMEKMRQIQEIELAAKLREMDRIKVNELSCSAHVQDIGWCNFVPYGETIGTVGQSKRIEAIKIKSNTPVKAKAHIANEGWHDYGSIDENTVIGTVGKCEALECLCFEGNFKYRVHIQNVGWSAWTNADGISTLGTVGQSLQLEAIEMQVL